jgi:pimeloyl-ACP methyl ester carboxylesterase
VAAASEEAVQFELGGEGVPRLRGESLGSGPPIVLLHGITATRRYVLHGSSTLARRGHRLVCYDARGHGESDPAPGGSGYGPEELSADLGRVLAAEAPGRPLLCGHSMGCHTVASYALEHPGEPAGAVLIGPVSLGLPPAEERLAYWDRLADGLERKGVEGFMRAYEAELEVEGRWREVSLRITRQRLELHRHPAALAQAIREVARSVPFDGLVELQSLDLPTLVVGSRDEADPAHPLSVAEAWAERLPRAELISEPAGESPLAWQGGRLSREIAAWLGRTGLTPADRAA